MNEYSQLRYRDMITYVVTYPFRRILTSAFIQMILKTLELFFFSYKESALSVPNETALSGHLFGCMHLACWLKYRPMNFQTTLTIKVDNLAP